MREKELKFDRRMHLLYSGTAKKMILRHLSRHVPAGQEDLYWEKIQLAYVEMLNLIPYLGGKKNMQAASVYDCAALFAFYKTVPDKPDLDEFEQMNREIFMPDSNRKWGHPDFNFCIVRAAAAEIWKYLSRNGRKHAADWPGNYIMEIQPVEEGTKYVFHRCPIAELAKSAGLEAMMPAMCNPDYAILGQMKAGLIRTETCGFGSFCDFWIVGDKSPCLKQYQKRKNAAGFIFNEKITELKQPESQKEDCNVIQQYNKEKI